MLNKEILKQYEHMFSSAINQQYVSGMQKYIFDIVLEEYRKQTGDTYNYTISCSNCVMQLFVKCGKLYFSQVDETKEVKNHINNKKK